MNTPLHNASNLLATMPSWYYFSRPTNTAFHNLLPCRPPYSFRSLLGLSLKFVPTPTRTPCPNQSLQRHTRDLLVKTFYAGCPFDDSSFDIKYHIRSDWIPPHDKIPREIHSRLDAFNHAFRKRFRKKRGSTNLIPIQHRTLKYLQNNKDKYVVATCDKNLGPALMYRDTYIQRALNDHLLDTGTYQRLDLENADGYTDILKRKLRKWISTNTSKGIISKQELNYFKKLQGTNTCAFAKFYNTIKIHKQPWKTRPIVSFSGCLLYSLGVWIDRQLQPFVRAIPSYIKNSYELKSLLLSLNLPPTALFFTADAVSMYTNLKTTEGLTNVKEFLQTQVNQQHLDHDRFIAINTGLEILMRNNLIQFGDTYWLQIEGTAMGAPPAPPYATITYGHHEHKFVPRHPNLLFYRRYIDDIIGIWLPDPDEQTNRLKWNSLCDDINGYHDLKWEIEEPTTSVTFMDLTLTVDNGAINTNLHEKDLNLYLYIPPHSNHSNSLLTGLVSGCIYRIFRLCSNTADAKHHLQNLLRRLVARGYNHQHIRSLINSLSLSINNRASQPDRIYARNENDNRLFFHIPYHQNNPPAHVIQDIWHTSIMEPAGAQPLHRVKNHEDTPVGISKLTVAYSRTPTLGEKLSNRNIERSAGPMISSFL